jgi:hypothetical protein
LRERLGALARYGSTAWSLDGCHVAFPWGTFVVNISGALVLGFLLTLMTEQLTTAPWLRSALTIGFSAPTRPSRRSSTRRIACSRTAQSGLPLRTSRERRRRARRVYLGVVAARAV